MRVGIIIIIPYCNTINTWGFIPNETMLFYACWHAACNQVQIQL